MLIYSNFILIVIIIIIIIIIIMMMTMTMIPTSNDHITDGQWIMIAACATEIFDTNCH